MSTVVMPKAFSEAVGRVLMDEIRAQGASMNGLADALGCTTYSLQTRLTQHARPLQVNELVVLCQALGVTASEIARRATQA